MANGHGGAREGAFTPLDPEQKQHRIDGEYWKARKLQAEALAVERDNEVAMGNLIERPAVAAAAATAVAAFAQSVRTIPDALERNLGLQPQVVEQIAVALDEALAGLATKLETLVEAGKPK